MVSCFYRLWVLGSLNGMVRLSRLEVPGSGLGGGLPPAPNRLRAPGGVGMFWGEGVEPNPREPLVASGHPTRVQATSHGACGTPRPPYSFSSRGQDELSGAARGPPN